MAFGWLACVLGYLLRRLAAIEAMFVLQFGWLNFVWLDCTLIMPFSGMRPLRYTTGYNKYFIEDQSPYSNSVPYTSQFGISRQYLINNYNLSFAMLVIPFILTVVTLIRYKLFTKKHSLKQNLQKIETSNETKIKKKITKLESHFTYAA